MVFLAAFLIPAAMYIVVLFATKTVPFGDNALIVSDTSNQFAAFFTYFKHILQSNDDFLYTFSKTLGGDMPGFSGYYLNNPLLFLLVFFKDAYVPAGIVLITGLSLCLMSVTMAVYLKDLAGEKMHPVIIVMFSSAYAFMGYTLAYITLPIYFCDLIMLPLVMLGIRRLVRGRKRLYIISLALSIIFNYYIGYMICIFSVLYFLYELLSEGKLREKKAYIDFALSSLAAGALSAFSVIPTVLSLKGQKESPSLSALSPQINFGLRAFLRNLFVGSFSGDLSNYSAPYIYVGEAVLVFVIVFFVSRNIKRGKKIAAAALLAILAVSTLISTFDVIWHGFNAPVGFAHRYSFLISATLISVGFEGCIMLCDRLGEKKPVKWIMPALAAAQIALLIVNAVISIRAYDNHPLSEYTAYYEHMDECISRIKEEDPSFYRIEKDFERNHNDSMMLGYYGLTHNSSCERDYVKEFAAKMGIRYFPPIWTFYNQGSTVFTDCFLGVKYFVSRFDTTIRPYSHVFDTEGENATGDDMTAYVYENPYALPLMFGMSEEELAADMQDPDLFELQNDMAGEHIYTRAADPPGNVTSDDEISVDALMPVSGNLYFYATAPGMQEAYLFVNGEPREEYFSGSRWNIVNIGRYEAGETVNVVLKAGNSPITVDDIYIYAEDDGAIAKWYEKASKEAGELTKITSSHLTGRITLSDSERIVFTFPYEKAWKISIDGKKAEPEEAFGALLSVSAPPGEHTIEMRYIPDGLIPGLIISVATLILCLGLTFYGRTIKIKP